VEIPHNLPARTCKHAAYRRRHSACRDAGDDAESRRRGVDERASERGVQLQQHPSGRRPVCIHLGMQRTAISRHQIAGGRAGRGRHATPTLARPTDRWTNGRHKLIALVTTDHVHAPPPDRKASISFQSRTDGRTDRRGKGRPINGEADSALPKRHGSLPLTDRAPRRRRGWGHFPPCTHPSPDNHLRRHLSLNNPNRTPNTTSNP